MTSGSPVKFLLHALISALCAGLTLMLTSLFAFTFMWGADGVGKVVILAVGGVIGGFFSFFAGRLQPLSKHPVRTTLLFAPGLWFFLFCCIVIFPGNTDTSHPLMWGGLTFIFLVPISWILYGRGIALKKDANQRVHSIAGSARSE